eukprot:COSAG05_NODE_23924_length_255_cov_0.461538_1_plen_50_part_01
MGVEGVVIVLLCVCLGGRGGGGGGGGGGGVGCEPMTYSGGVCAFAPATNT